MRTAERKLEVILNNYVDSLAGTTIDVFSSTFGHRLRNERRFASKLMSTEKCRVGDHEALIATISISDVDQLQLDLDHVFGTIRLALVRFTGKMTNLEWINRRHAGVKKSGEVLLIAGYFNSAKYFEKHLDDFEGLLARIEFLDNGKNGLIKVESLPEETAQEQPGEVAQEPVEEAPNEKTEP